MKKLITVVQLKCDNFDGLVSIEAYEEIRLQMSTGDYHTHKAKKVRVPINSDIYTLDDLEFDSNL